MFSHDESKGLIVGIQLRKSEQQKARMGMATSELLVTSSFRLIHAP